LPGYTPARNIAIIVTHPRVPGTNPMYLDIFLIAVMLISGMLAMVRGLIREVLSIAGWVAAAGAALYAYSRFLPAAKAYFNNDYVAIGVTTLGAFLATLIVVSVITVRISDKVLDSRIGALDRTLGFLFGLARGLIIVVVAFAFFDWLVPAKSQPTWVTSAHSIEALKSMRDGIMSMSPDIEAWYSKYKRQRGNDADPPV
jgi:membrane protein required for colicin V production